MRVIGIDPGSVVMGFACLSISSKGAITIDDLGIVRPPRADSFEARLKKIHDACAELASKHAPDFCCVEAAFFGKNASSALKLGMARGAIVTALMRHVADVRSMAPKEVKALVAGRGGATKEEVCAALEWQLGVQLKGMRHDATDALGVALAGLITERFTAARGPSGFARRPD